MLLCAAVQFWNSTYRWFNKHSSWLSLAIRIESYGEDSSQNQGRCTNNAHWGHNILLRHCRSRAILFRTNRWWRRDWGTNRWEERPLSKKGNRTGSTWGTILNGSMKPSKKEFTKIDGKTTSYSIYEIKANARIRIEKEVDLALKNLKLKIVGQPYDEVLLTNDKRFRHYKAIEDRIILKDELLCRNYYGKTGNIKYYQILIPKQLVDEKLRSLHREFGKHPGFTKTIIAYRQKYYYPNMAKLIRQSVISCDRWNRESRVDDRLTQPALQNPSTTHRGTGRRQANRFGSGFTAVWWLWKHSNSHGCVFQIFICLSYFQPRCKNDSKSHIQRHGQTCLVAEDYHFWQGISVLVSSNQRSGWSSRNHHKTCQSMHKQLECLNERMPHSRKL